MNMLQIGIVGVLGALLAVQFKGGKTEYGIYMSVAVSILLFTCIIDRLELFVNTVEQIGSYISFDTRYIATMLKMIGITYIGEFCSSICKDAGYQTVAGQIEVLGKLSVMFAGLPILFAVIEQIQNFL